MAKKIIKKNSPPKPYNFTEVWGFVIMALALIILLSLLSFSLHGTQSNNWIGFIGYTLGWVLTALFGVGSYLIGIFIGWMGWRLIFKHSLNNILLKSICALTAILSTCMLLSVLEDKNELVAYGINKVLYKEMLEKKSQFHLGGAPTFYFYQDLPNYNLRYLLNALGVTIFFSCSLLVSLLFLAKFNVFTFISKLKNVFTRIEWPERIDLSGFQKNKEETLKVLKKEAPLLNLKDEKQETESDFLRYVKLRIPNQQTSLADTAISDQQNEMLAIQPEHNLKSRPSLSRKEEIDGVEEKKLIEKSFLKLKKHEHIQLPVIHPEKKQEIENKILSLEAPKKQRRDKALAEQRVHNGDFTEYKLPTLNLITHAKKLDQSSLKKDLKRKAEVLEETLLSFGIEAKVGQINCGPTITSFEVHPAIGVKVQKIKSLENDVALNMEAKSIRIIAPIPGKAAVGIEVPNAQPEEVGFKEMLSAYQQEEKKFRIPILLGKAVNGDYVMSDLTKMPHCIIAGATGSGKSVCINTIVMSILMNAKPDEIKLIMVDPKKVELTPYTRLPHMLSPVITDPQEACAAMNWLVKEMERRYDLLKLIGARNIEAFNSRTIDKAFEIALDEDIPEKLPYIVGIIDELADLMMVSSSDIETPIARIAQMARAVGIHLILATQRPSREVITGLIKANFPTRISFKVSSRVNSQIILDDIGAESLLGNGDMLFLPPGASHLVRAQGAFIRDEDINAVVKSITDQAPPRYVIESFNKIGKFNLSEDEEKLDEGDALYPNALDIISSTGNASTTFLQRKLKIGYARAASLIDVLEKRGIVGPADGSKPRKVLIGKGVKESLENSEEESFQEEKF